MLLCYFRVLLLTILGQRFYTLRRRAYDIILPKISSGKPLFHRLSYFFSSMSIPSTTLIGKMKYTLGEFVKGIVLEAV